MEQNPLAINLTDSTTLPVTVNTLLITMNCLSRLLIDKGILTEEEITEKIESTMALIKEQREKLFKKAADKPYDASEYLKI